jgi:hypothetical protein
MQVPHVPGRPALLDAMDDLLSELLHGFDANMASVQRRAIASNEHCSGEIERITAREHSRALPPVGQQIGQRMRGLLRARFPRGLLRQLGAFNAGRGPAMLGTELRNELSRTGLHVNCAF